MRSFNHCLLVAVSRIRTYWTCGTFAASPFDAPKDSACRVAPVNFDSSCLNNCLTCWAPAGASVAASPRSLVHHRRRLRSLRHCFRPEAASGSWYSPNLIDCLHRLNLEVSDALKTFHASARQVCLPPTRSKAFSSLTSCHHERLRYSCYRGCFCCSESLASFMPC